MAITKPTDTADGLVERWGNNLTSGLVSPAQVTTPGDDMTLTNAGWGSDTNGKYYAPAAATDCGRATNTSPGFAAANHDFSVDICILDDGSTPGGAFDTMCFGGDNTGGSPDTSFYIIKRADTGKYRAIVNGPSGLTLVDSTLAFQTGLVYFVLTWSISTGTATLYANGVSTGAVTTGFNNYTVQAINMGAYNGPVLAFEKPIYFMSIYSTAMSAPTVAARYAAIIAAPPAIVHQSDATASGAATSLSCTVPVAGIPAKAQALLILNNTVAIASSSYTVTDSKGNTWVLDKAANSIGAVASVLVYRAFLTTALVSGDTVTITSGVVNSIAINSIASLYSLTGITAGVDGVDASNSAFGTGTSAAGAITTTDTGDLLVPIIGWKYALGQTPTVPAGYTSAGSATATGTGLTVASLVGGAPATINPAWGAVNVASYDALVMLAYEASPNDFTPPTVASASCAADGVTWTFNFTEADAPPVLPASGVTGFTANIGGASAAFSAFTISGTTGTATCARKAFATEIISVGYTPGNVTDSATPPNSMIAFTALSVTNNSTQTVDVPTNLAIVGTGNGSITLTWTPNTASDPVNVYRGTTAGGESGTPIAVGVSAPYKDTGRTNGTVYYYKVKSNHNGMLSGFSNETSGASSAGAGGGAKYCGYY